MNLIRIIMTIVCLFASLPAFSEENGTVIYTVDEAVSEVLTKNTQMHEAEERIKSARETLTQSKTDFLPKASMSYSYTKLADAPIMKQGGGEVPVGHEDQYHWDLNLVQPVFTGFSLTSQLKLAKLDLDTGIIEKEERRMTLVRDTKAACYEYLLAGKMAEVAREEVEALKAHRDEAGQFFSEGLIPRNDLLKSEVALSSAIQGKERADANLLNAMAFVNMLMNNDVDRVIGIKDIEKEVIRDTAAYSELAQEAKANRPELRILKNNIQAAETGKTLAQQAYYPEVSLVGRYERNGDSLSMSDNEYSNNDNTSLTVQATWTFFEWGKTRADVRRATHDKRGLEQALKNAENRVCLEVNNALRNLKVAGKNIRTAQNALEQAEENWRITKAQYAQQIATSSDVLDARTFLTNADSNYYGALYGYMISYAELERAAGRQ